MVCEEIVSIELWRVWLILGTLMLLQCDNRGWWLRFIRQTYLLMAGAGTGGWKEPFARLFLCATINCPPEERWRREGPLALLLIMGSGDYSNWWSWLSWTQHNIGLPTVWGRLRDQILSLSLFCVNSGAVWEAWGRSEPLLQSCSLESFLDTWTGYSDLIWCAYCTPTENWAAISEY